MLFLFGREVDAFFCGKPSDLIPEVIMQKRRTPWYLSSYFGEWLVFYVYIASSKAR